MINLIVLVDANIHNKIMMIRNQIIIIIMFK